MFCLFAQNNRYREKSGVVSIGGTLSNILSDYKSNREVIEEAMANDRKDVFHLAGVVNELGSGVGSAVSSAVKSVIEGKSTLDDEFKKMREVDVDRVTSVHGVVQAFVQVIEGFLAQSRLGFDDIHSKIRGFEQYTDQRLTDAGQRLLHSTSQAQPMLDALRDKVANMTAQMAEFDRTAQDDVLEVQARIGQVMQDQE
jgi:hypothetical protein